MKPQSSSNIAKASPFSILQKGFGYIKQYGFFRIRTRARSLKYRIVYRHAIGDPLDLILVTHSNINHYLSPRFGPRSSIFRIRGGNWDYEKRQFIENYDMYIAFKNHFNENVPWEKTNFYQRVSSEIKSGKVKWGCSSEQEFRTVCNRFDALYESIDNYGLLTMSELAEINSEAAQYPPRAHEVCVAIGRDGTVMSDEGRHRMFIAKILGLESIPVRVLVRHKKWQAIRNRFARAEDLTTLPEFTKFGSHPDLQDIVDNRIDVDRSRKSIT